MQQQDSLAIWDYLRLLRVRILRHLRFLMYLVRAVGGLVVALLFIAGLLIHGSFATQPVLQRSAPVFQLRGGVLSHHDCFLFQLISDGPELRILM